jgi:Lipocalin-like domain
MTALRDRILGGWELVSFISQNTDNGAVTYPLGRRACGLLMYTEDGFMSAQLTRGRQGGVNDPGSETVDSSLSGYVAYGGRFEIDERSATLRHLVTISMLDDLLLQPQFRHASLDGDRLTLSATATAADGTRSLNTLVWKRAGRDETR